MKHAGLADSQRFIENNRAIPISDQLQQQNTGANQGSIAPTTTADYYYCCLLVNGSPFRCPLSVIVSNSEQQKPSTRLIITPIIHHRYILLLPSILLPTTGVGINDIPIHPPSIHRYTHPSLWSELLRRVFRTVIDSQRSIAKIHFKASPTVYI